MTFSNPFLNTSHTISLKVKSSQFKIDSNFNLISNTSSQWWITSWSNIYYNYGNVGIGTNNPLNILQVGDGGRLKIGSGITDFTLIGTKDDIMITQLILKYL